METLLKRLESIESKLCELAPDKEHTQREIIDVAEVSRLTMLAKATIYKKCCYKELPYYRQGKRSYFDRAEIMAWMKQNKI